MQREDIFPTKECYIECPHFTGWTEVVVAPIKPNTIIIGNVENATKLSPMDSEPPKSVSPIDNKKAEIAVITRNASKNVPVHPLVLPKLNPINIQPKDFADLQLQCPTLGNIRDKAEAKETIITKDGNKFIYEWTNGLLYRRYIASKYPNKVGSTILLIPAECKTAVLSTAHESAMAGHFSHRKTEQKIKSQFHWPQMSTDIRNFCRSCDKCQRVAPKGAVKRVPLMKMPILTEPFSRVAVDLVGPLSPPSSDGHRYILTLIDIATGFPEAVPLKTIDSIAVSEALMHIFSRVGIPKEILSDRGAQFTSALMGEIHKMAGLKPLFTTPYHPMCNGRIERIHSTMKACLKKLCSTKPKEWHRYLVPTMFALREMPSDRTGFSAFELLYGRQVRGPIAVLRDLWENKSLNEDNRTQYQYVIELRSKLEECAKIAAENSNISATKYKQYFDLKSQNRQFSPGDEVLLLLPDSSNKLLMAWKGPAKVLERRNRVDYLIELDGKQKLYHANLLKKYYTRGSIARIEGHSPQHPLDCEALTLTKNLPVIHQQTEENNEQEEIYTIEPDIKETPTIGKDLSASQEKDVETLIEKYKDVLSPIPGCTNAVTHDIILQTNKPIRAKVYPVPLHLKTTFDKEVDNLFEIGVIRSSTAPNCSPCVMVKKSDGTYRLTIDYRALNANTVFQAETPCIADETPHKFTNAKYFSEIDLAKAYYQVKLTEQAIPLTAFPTSRGLMEFVRMPFGLVGAAATHIKMMRKILHGLPNVAFYFDNIFVYSQTWSEHVQALEAVFQTLKQHQLTARPSKCKFALNSLNYLGFDIENNVIKPKEHRIAAIATIPPPTTQKALRSFLGLISFYRKFIMNAAQLTAPLSDLLKKQVREPLKWDETALDCFGQLKKVLCEGPILRLPDARKPFVVRSDACNQSVGAILLQYHDDEPHPVAYISRKLQDNEKNYSTIEKECLAIIFALKKLKFYLVGQGFILEVDHRPLIYLNKFKGENDRLMRWALALQSFRFRIVYIAGKDNLGADLLSRNVK